MARKEDAFFLAVRELAAAYDVRAYVVVGVIVGEEGDLLAAGYGASRFDAGKSGTRAIHDKMRAVATEAMDRLDEIKGSPGGTPPTGGMLN
jgi:hypothetical protein